MKKTYKSLILTGISLLLLAGCGSVKEELGITREAPDEFTVMKRAPLSMPPDYALRPPRPGAPRPQDEVTEENARTAVFGSNSQASQAGRTTADAVLLQETGADAANPDIRQTIDRETANTAPRSKPVAEKLLGWTHKKKVQEPATTVVDPVK